MKILIVLILAAFSCHQITVSAMNDSVITSLYSMGPYNISFNLSTSNNYDITKNGPEINKFVNPDIGLYYLKLVDIHDNEKTILITMSKFASPESTTFEDRKKSINGLAAMFGVRDTQIFPYPIDNKSGIVGVLPDPSEGKNYDINYWIDDNGYMGTLKCDISAYGIKWEEVKELLDTIHVEQISI